MMKDKYHVLAEKIEKSMVVIPDDENDGYMVRLLRDEFIDAISEFEVTKIGEDVKRIMDFKY